MQKGKLPDAFEMVKIKKRRIKDEVETIIATQHQEDYLSYAMELLQENEGKDVVAALLKHFVKDELNPKAYKQIKESKVSDDLRKQHVKLFYAKGRKDNITPRIILDTLKKDTGIDSRKINDIRIMDAFSFFVTNGEDAEFILSYYKKDKSRKMPLVERARERR